MKFHKEPTFWMLLLILINGINLGIMLGKNIESKKCLSTLEYFENRLNSGKK